MIRRIIVNLVGFQTGWLASVLGAAGGYIWLGPAVVPLVIALNLALSPTRRRDVVAILAIGIVGGLLDTAIMALGIITFPGGAPYELPLFALWVTALWLNFAATLRVSLRWLTSRHLLSAVLGGIGGSTTYLAGAKLGAIGLHENTALALIVIAIEWAIALPIAVHVANTLLDRRPAKPPTGATAHAA